MIPAPRDLAQAQGAAGNLEFGFAFAPVILAIFFALSAAWWSFSTRSGRLTRRQWRFLLRVTGAIGLTPVPMALIADHRLILAAIALRPAGILLPLAGMLALSLVLLVFPWKWGSEPDASPPLGLDMDAAAAAAPQPPRARTRARLTVANAYAWLIVAAVAYIGIRWLFRHV